MILKLLDLIKNKGDRENRLPNISLFPQIRNVNYNTFTGWVFACINHRAKAVADTNIYFENQINYNQSEPFAADFWLNQMFDNPNPYYSFYTIKSLIVKWLDLHGNAYIYTPLSNNTPIGLWVLPSDTTKPIYNKEIIGYDVRLGGSLFRLNKNEVIHFKTLSPTNKFETSLFQGTPELITASMNAILTEAEKSRFLQDYLSRDMTEPYVITTPERIDAHDWQRFKSLYNESLPRQYQALAILDEGKKAEILGKNHSTLNIDLKEVKEQITSIFGVPLGLMTGDLANRATAEVLLEHYHRNTINPILTMICEDLTRHFKQFDNRIKFTYNEYQSSNIDDKIKWFEFLIHNGIQTAENIAAELGYVSEFEQLEDEKIYKEIDVKKAYWYDNYKSMLKYSNKIKAILKAEFRLLEAEILDTNKGTKLLNYQNLFDGESFFARVYKKVKPQYKNLAKDVITQAIRIIGGKVGDFDEVISSAVDVSTSKIKTSINTIQTNLHRDINNALTNNPTLNSNEIRELINSVIKNEFKEVLAIRVETITTTTTTVAVGEAQKRAYTKRGFTPSWLSRRDDRVRDTHYLVDGQKPDDNGLFHVGDDVMPAPAQGSIAKENVNCRCTLFPDKNE